MCVGGRRILQTPVEIYVHCADKSPPHEQNILKNKYSKLTIEKCYKGQNLLDFFL
jgi:hypothetical protein